MADRLILTGPTASGKGRAAHQLALRLGGEIILVDSMKIYREMDVGTAKPSLAARAEVRYHLLDVADPSEEFSVGRWRALALEAVRDIEGRGRRVILCGGTLFYLSALLRGLFRGPAADWDLRRSLEEEAAAIGSPALHRRLEAADPEAAKKIHPHDLRRIVRALEVAATTGRAMTDLWREGAAERLEEGSYRLFGIERARAPLYRRIDARVLRMREEGLFAEARRLFARPGGVGRSASRCIGYREIREGDSSGASEDSTVALIQRDSRRFAKQQITWLKRFPIRWIETGDGASAEEIVAAILRELSEEGSPRGS